MKKWRLIINVIILLSASLVFAQPNYKGQILDQQTMEALAYVNIGVMGESIGTVSQLDGGFVIELDDRYDQDSLKFSMIGYKDLTFKVADFKKVMGVENTFHMEQSAATLQEVVVTPENLKLKQLGKKTTSSAMVGGFSSDMLGAEAGVILKVKKSPTYLESFHVHIAKSEYDTIKLRLNFYNLKDKLPYQKIQKEDIIIIRSIKKGMIDVDLRPFNLVMEEAFFVSLEWLEDMGDKSLDFSIGLFGPPLVFRNTSQAPWEKVKAISAGFHLKVRQ